MSIQYSSSYLLGAISVWNFKLQTEIAPNKYELEYCNI